MFMDYTNVIKKQTKIIALSVFIMVIGILGVSYALFMKVDQSDEQTVQSGSLIMQLSAYAGSTVISSNDLPIDDSEGLLTKGYSFSVTNNGTLPITYYIALYDNPDDTSTNKLSYDYIKVSLDNGTPFTLGSITTKDSAGRSILKQDISLAPDKYDTHNIKIWIDSETPESEIGKTISLKIYAYGEVCEDGKCNGGKTDYTKQIISQLDTTGKCPTVNDDGSVSVTGVEATDGYLCKAKDAYGDSYYYRGNVTNNYVKFGKWSNDIKDVIRGYYSDTTFTYKEYSSLEECQNASSYNTNCTLISKAGKDMYWRIIRINGDGTVRVIYDGTSTHTNGESTDDRQIGIDNFNGNYPDLLDDNAYVGYMYGTIAATSYTMSHINTHDSTIKTYIDDWYKTNILGTTNEQYLADNIFCNDRSISSNKPDSNYNNLGYGNNATAYRWYYAPWSSEKYNINMKLICSQQNDAFTVSDTTNGNGALKYPIGLITMDEAVLAGGWNVSNKNYYLYSGQSWWSITPYETYLSNRENEGIYIYGPMVNAINEAGNLDFKISTSSVPIEKEYYSMYGSVPGIRPILNLNAEVLSQGTGTSSDPYRLFE